MTLQFENSIKKELSMDLKEKIVNHRVRFKEFFKARYMEMLPSLIKYTKRETVAVDFMKVEVALRNGYDIVIGQTTMNNIQVLGFANSRLSSQNPADLFSTDKMRQGDITFTIPKHLRQSYYQEISSDDSYKSGNFVVLRNKTLSYVHDHTIIEHYIDELAEIVLSRFSISMQIKISTIFLSEPGDETIGQLISDLYNGSPYIKMSEFFDPQEQIYHMENQGLAENFLELKREYNNKIAELNNAIGINSLAVEKSSGVSDEEANSNRGFTTSNANIYLDGRNHGLKALNKRYNTDIQAMYNDEVESELQDLEMKDDTQAGGDNNGDNNPVQSNQVGTDESGT